MSRKGKNVSFDAMVKYFIQTYSIPTKKDIDKLNSRLDHLEVLILKSTECMARDEKGTRKARGRTVTASDTVLNIVKEFKQGVNFSEIQARTGFEEKKLRNIIFRLNDIGKIKRKTRGVYTAI